LINAGSIVYGTANAINPFSTVTVSSTTAGVTALLDLNGTTSTLNQVLTFGGSTTTSTANVSTGAGALVLGNAISLASDITYVNTNNPLGSTLSGNLSLAKAKAVSEQANTLPITAPRQMAKELRK